jgi:hypothetical protein
MCVRFVRSGGEMCVRFVRSGGEMCPRFVRSGEQICVRVARGGGRGVPGRHAAWRKGPEAQPRLPSTSRSSCSLWAPPPSRSASAGRRAGECARQTPFPPAAPPPLRAQVPRRRCRSGGGARTRPATRNAKLLRRTRHSDQDRKFCWLPTRTQPQNGRDVFS